MRQRLEHEFEISGTAKLAPKVVAKVCDDFKFENLCYNVEGPDDQEVVSDDLLDAINTATLPDNGARDNERLMVHLRQYEKMNETERHDAIVRC